MVPPMTVPTMRSTPLETVISTLQSQLIADQEPHCPLLARTGRHSANRDGDACADGRERAWDRLAHLSLKTMGTLTKPAHAIKLRLASETG